jgi:hypothetical protein
LANLPARAELQSWQKLHPVGWHRHIESEETGNKQAKDTFYSAPPIQDNISTFKISQRQLKLTSSALDRAFNFLSLQFPTKVEFWEFWSTF